MTTIQAPAAQPTIDEIRDWIDSEIVEVPRGWWLGARSVRT